MLREGGRCFFSRICAGQNSNLPLWHHLLAPCIPSKPVLFSLPTWQVLRIENGRHAAKRLMQYDPDDAAGGCGKEAMCMFVRWVEFAF